MDLERRQTTWLGEAKVLPRERTNAVTTTPEAKKDKKRPPPLRLSAHPSAWAKPASSLSRLGDSQRSLKLTAEDPWHRYEKILGVRVGGAAVLAEREDSGAALFVIRRHRHQPREAEAKLYMIQVLQHEHFQMALEVFLWSGELCIVSPYVEISVLEIIHAPLNPSESKVACVAQQALDGMVFLEANGFVHGHITAENLLLEDSGQLRIALMEDCHKAGDAEDQSADVRKLGVIVVQLMEKDTTTNEEMVVLKRPKEWSESAIGFVRDSSDVAARKLIGLVTIFVVVVMHKVSRRYQTWLDANEITLRRDYDDTFWGTARVRLDNLAFNKPGKPEPKKVSRLKHIFESQGILRLKPDNHVRAFISEEQLRDALRSSNCTQDQLCRPPDALPVELIFPLDFELRCPYGKHRIAAAREVLSTRNRWWCVDLHSRDVERGLRNELEEDFVNEARPSDGEIYCSIERYKREDNEPEQRRWWAHLTPSKKKYLRQFHRSPLYGIFNRLLRFDGLCLGINIGTMHKVVALHVEEEIARYVEHIETVWMTVLGPERGSVADSDTIVALQSRVPKMCTDDRKWLADQMNSHSIFSSVTNVGARDRLWQRLLTIDVLIPSFHTLFEDLKYLSLCKKVVARLLPLRLKHSVFETLSDLYTRSHSLERSYKELWLYAMRSWPSMIVERPRQGRQCPRSSTAGSPTSWEEFSRFVEGIGFGHPQVVGSNPEPPSEMESVSVSFTTSGKGIPVQQRCGIPFQDSQEIDKETLVFNVILGPVGEPVAGITWPFVRRCFFVAFFGTFDDTPSDMEPTAATGTLPPENRGPNRHPVTALTPFSGADVAMEDTAEPAAAVVVAETLPRNRGYVQRPETALVPFSAVGMTIEDNARLAAETDLDQYSETALVPLPGGNVAMKRSAGSAADGLHADNVIHFLTHTGAPLGYQPLSGDELLDQEEVRCKALRYFQPGTNRLFVQSRTISPNDAFHAATRHNPPEIIYVVPHRNEKVFLAVRQWDSLSGLEARAERAWVNPQELAHDEVSEESEI